MLDNNLVSVILAWSGVILMGFVGYYIGRGKTRLEIDIKIRSLLLENEMQKIVIEGLRKQIRDQK